MSTQQWPFFLKLHYFSSLIMSLGFKTQMRKKCARSRHAPPLPPLCECVTWILFFSSVQSETYQCAHERMRLENVKKVFFFWPIFWLSFRPRKPDCKLHKKLTQLGKGKKSESLSWKPIQCVVKILAKLSPKKSDKKWNFRTLKQWSDSPEHLITNFCARKAFFVTLKLMEK